jgi:hypothetical protein
MEKLPSGLGTLSSDRRAGQERRRTVRYSVNATVVVVEVKSRTRMTGRVSDLSSTGCYVDTISPFPLETAVQFRLSCEGRSLQGEARVSYSLPGMGMGMGLAFTSLAADQLESLRAWIGSLSGEVVAEAQESDLTLAFEDPAEHQKVHSCQGAIEELITTLQKKGVLTEQEKNAVRKKLA